MSNLLLIVFVVSVVVVLIMVKQINKITSNIDEKEARNQPSAYAKFAATIQENIRAIKADIDHSKDTPSPTYILKDNEDEEKSLEFLADTIRKLVFFETMNSKRRDSKDIENELFGVLSSLDEFINKYIQNGEELADKLRDKLSKDFSKIEQES